MISPNHLHKIPDTPEGSQLLPVILPGTHSSTIFISPGFFQLEQIGFGLFPGGRLIDGFQVSDESLFVSPGDIFQRVSDTCTSLRLVQCRCLVDDTALHPGFWENGMNRI